MSSDGPTYVQSFLLLLYVFIFNGLSSAPLLSPQEMTYRVSSAWDVKPY